jgi:hypothetical protein
VKAAVHAPVVVGLGGDDLAAGFAAMARDTAPMR